MRLRSILDEAAQALRFNRQRSILTVMSLAWGVACFVILYSYGEGFDYTLQTAFLAIGQDLIVTFPGQYVGAGRRRAGGAGVYASSLDDVEAIRESVPTVAAISPEADAGQRQRGAGLSHANGERFVVSARPTAGFAI